MFSEYIGVVQRTHGLNGTVLLTDTIFQHLSLPVGTEIGIGYSKEHVKRVAVAEFSVTPQRTTLAHCRVYLSRSSTRVCGSSCVYNLSRPWHSTR